MTSSTKPRDIVLLVDDSPEALSFLTEALEQTGYSVLIATSGTSALTIVDRITPDLVLLDAVMPGLDGFETCTRLKADPAAAQIPVIFMTGLTESEHVVRALEAGGVDYVTKPINIDELVARISVHLANARSAQSARVALDASGRHLLAVRKNGKIHWSTPQATRLVNSALGDENGLEKVALRIVEWMDSRADEDYQRDSAFTLPTADNATLQIAFVGAIGADEYLFRLTGQRQFSETDQLRRSLGLTGRESEVLAWIAKGKSNRDIGEILGLSSRTVNKHLEQIYVKLGVENRASAAVKAASILMQD